MSKGKHLSTDDELAAVTVKIREAGDLTTAIEEGHRIRRPLSKDNLDLAENAAALVHIMSSDELDELADTLKRASDPDQAPLVQTFLVMAQFWARNENARRWDANYEALTAASGGHLVGVAFDGNGPGGRDWYAYCACREGHDAPYDYRDIREEALADMTAHMFEYGLTEAAIDSVDGEDAREEHDAMLAPYLEALRENPDAFKRSRPDEA